MHHRPAAISVISGSNRVGMLTSWSRLNGFSTTDSSASWMDRFRMFTYALVVAKCFIESLLQTSSHTKRSDYHWGPPTSDCPNLDVWLLIKPHWTTIRVPSRLLRNKVGHNERPGEWPHHDITSTKVGNAIARRSDGVISLRLRGSEIPPENGPKWPKKHFCPILMRYRRRKS